MRRSRGRPFSSAYTYPHKSSSGEVNILWRPELGAYELHFPYNKVLVETIKAKVPSNERNYDPDNNHAWFLSEQWYTALLPLMEALFQDCQFNIIDKKKVEEYSQGAATSYLEPTEKMVADFKALIIVAVPTTPENGEFNKLPLNEVQKYYRKAALYYHPDRNPQFASEMTRLNQLFMELKKLEYWK